MGYTNPTSAEYSGTALAFAFNSTYTPTSLSGFAGRTIASSDAEPEVFQTATNGEGQVEAVALSVPAQKVVNIQLAGYVTTTFNKFTLPNTFVDGGGPLAGRKWFIKKISDPVPKGAYIEVTIDAVSYPLITP